MLFFRHQFLNAHFLIYLITVVASDKRWFQKSIGKGRNISLENSTRQPYNIQKPELKLHFTKKLNEMQSLAELSTLLMQGDRRFCAHTTLTILEGLNGTDKHDSKITQLQDHMSKLKNYCAQIKRGRAASVQGLKLHEITEMNAALLEAKKAACKPRTILKELPPAPFGSSYYPQYVTVKQCDGCCNSALLKCTPVKITNVTKWVMNFVMSRNKYKSTQSFQMEQHEKCKCGCKHDATPTKIRYDSLD
ncbi:uncharacterized protein LOC110830060 isoform X2 [Zootermopsis nevadensis]|uniref:uncharacterized protein LOC110830060 isoform X2 n=1 Tax=Zootermopsis nevadensis TaxID=136037 RepID=UPI000B8E81DD|nr:uncharacterized protein LOC110830060 isoform X2 [Zootermopsis nevadensis]